MIVHDHDAVKLKSVDHVLPSYHHSHTIDAKMRKYCKMLSMKIEILDILHPSPFCIINVIVEYGGKKMIHRDWQWTEDRTEKSKEKYISTDLHLFSAILLDVSSSQSSLS